MHRVYTARDAAEAHLIRGYLEESGIAAVVEGEALSIGVGGLPAGATTAPCVSVVNEADVETAKMLIDERPGNASPTHCRHCGYDLTGAPEPVCPECGRPFRLVEPWVCPNCGETIEGQFTECWRCATGEDG